MTDHKTLIDTPYGRKTPDLLCAAMDALELQPTLLAALRRLTDSDPTNSEVYEYDLAFARDAIAKANINTTGE